MPSLPRIAVTMGDPAGVGPELCLRLLNESALARECIPIVLGDAGILRRVAEVVGLPFAASLYPASAGLVPWEAMQGPSVVDFGILAADAVTPGVCSAATGRAAFTYIERAIDAALAGVVAGVATAPLNKEALHAAGIHFPGHTEIFAARTHAPRSCMMQYSDEITCSFVTVHVGYRDVPALLTAERILDVIELTAAALHKLRGRTPRLAACGLNPHAGEHGLFGDREEERIIAPALDKARARGIAIEGPLPPDTCFTPAKRKEIDAFICMYHDQGHIPVKALAFDRAVNTTLGLPIVRTSVDHGTANDIAWRGAANPGSLFAAVRLALRLAQ